LCHLYDPCNVTPLVCQIWQPIADGLRRLLHDLPDSSPYIGLWSDKPSISSSLLFGNFERIRTLENITQSCFGITFGLRADYNILENRIPKIPDKQQLLETDSPYLPPEKDMRINHPVYIKSNSNSNIITE
jgi:hypothetical protein